MSVIEITPAMRKLIDDLNALKTVEEKNLVESASGAAAALIDGMLLQSNLPRPVIAPTLMHLIAKVASLYGAEVYAKTRPDLFRKREEIDSVVEEMHTLSRCILAGSFAELSNLTDVMREVINRRLDIEEGKQ